MSASVVSGSRHRTIPGFGQRKYVTPAPLPPKAAAPRMDWVDYAKGWCIILVVMMHTVGGFNEALGETGWINSFVAFAKPFRMPDFFLIAGLFLSRSIDLPWQRFLDRKVLHFVYFYALWVTIQLVLKQGGILLSSPLEFVRLYITAFVQPMGTLWFIFILPIFYAVTKWARDQKLSGVAIIAGAATVEIAYQTFCFAAGFANPGMHIGSHALTGWVVFDEFCQRYVFFAAGYVLAPYIFQLAEIVVRYKLGALVVLCAWAVVNGSAIFTSASEIGLGTTNTSIAGLPVVSLILGVAGAMAVVAVSAMLAELKGLGWLRLLGSRSIIVYLAFFLPMVAMRLLVLKVWPTMDVSLASLVSTAVAVASPLGIHLIARKVGADFLFERPDIMRLEGAGSSREFAGA